MALEQGLDLARLDAEAAQLDLAVEAAEELQGAVGPVAGQVAGGVEADRGAVGSGPRDEALGGQLGAIEVAAGQAVAADVQLARHADRDGPAAAVEEVDLRVGDGAAERDGGVGVLDLVQGGPDGRLGRAVEVGQAAAGVEQVAGEGPREGLAAAEDVQPAPPRQPASRSMRQVVGVACMTVAPEESIRAARARPWRATSRGAITTRAPTSRGRKSSRAAMSKESEVAASRTSPPATPRRSRMAARRLTRARWGIGDALGGAGGAGGVDHVGEVVGGGGRGGGVGREGGDGVAVAVAVEADDLGVGGGQQGGEVPRGEQEGDAGIPEHEGEAVGGVGGVEGEVGAAGLHDGERGDEHVEGAVEADGDQGVGADGAGWRRWASWLARRSRAR